MKPRPKDPAALMAFERLTGVPIADDEYDLTQFQPGDETTDTICHVSTFTEAPTTDSDDFLDHLVAGLSRVYVEIYLGRNGTELLQLAQAKRQEFETKGWSIILIIELSSLPEKGQTIDFFEGHVFELVTPDPANNPPKEVLRQMLPFMPHILTQVSKVVGMSRQDFEKRLEELADASSILDPAIKWAAEGGGALLGLAADGITEFATFLNENSRMPRELWDPKVRPQDLAKALAGLNDNLETKMDGAIREIAGADLGLDEAVALTKHIPALGEVVIFVRDKWNALQLFMTNIINIIREALGSAGDSIDTILGYLSGLWDGIMEAIIGFIELAALILRVVGAFLAASHNPARIGDILRETTDEIIQALGHVDWMVFWSRFADEILPLIIELLKEKGNDFIDSATRNSAVAGYYFGYLVYTVIEFFMPPLKFATISKKLRPIRAAVSSRFFSKVMS